jgi:hypothetical protein
MGEYNWLVVWNIAFMTVPSCWEFQNIPTDLLHHFFRGVAKNHQPDTFDDL